MSGLTAKQSHESPWWENWVLALLKVLSAIKLCVPSRIEFASLSRAVLVAVGVQEQAVKLCKKEYAKGDTHKVEDLTTAYTAVKEVRRFKDCALFSFFILCAGNPARY